MVLLMTPTNNALFGSDLWKQALEKYAKATHVTVKLFDADENVVFGPIHPTPLFQLFDEKGYDPGISPKVPDVVWPRPRTGPP